MTAISMLADDFKGIEVDAHGVRLRFAGLSITILCPPDDVVHRMIAAGFGPPQKPANDTRDVIPLRDLMKEPA